MDIILCGAGDIGSAAAEMLISQGDDVTLIDPDDERLEYLESPLDIAVLSGSGSSASILRAAGAATADAVIATTDVDEINLVICDIAASLGTRRTLARVDHSMFMNDERLNYASIFSVDQMFSPDRAMARAMASRLRNPAAIAIEHFADSGIELQQIGVEEHAPAIGQSLRELGMPKGARLAGITRGGHAFLPAADSIIEQDDVVTLVAQVDVLAHARQLFSRAGYGRRTLAINGGPAAAVWLCRYLGPRDFDIRLFEPDLTRAERLGEMLDHATVLHADPGMPEVFDDENLANVDAFVSMRSDEQNMLACAYARQQGVENVMPVIRHNEFLPLLEGLGLTQTWNPRAAAAQTILRVLHCRDLERIDGFFDGNLELMRLRVSADAPAVGRTLVQLGQTPPLVVLAAEETDGTPVVPSGELVVSPGGHMIILSATSDAEAARRLFQSGASR